MDHEDLDYTHMIKGTITISDTIDWGKLSLQHGDIVVNATIPSLLTLYRMWRTNELRELAHAHEIRLRAREDASKLRNALDEHICSRCCPTVVVIFRPLKRRRNTAQVDRVRESIRGLTVTCGRSFTDIASDELKRQIIREWQDAFSTDRFRTSVCGPCGRRTLISKLVTVSVSQVDLTLLRNDGLPSKVYPTTYNFAAYQRVILDPKGLVDLDSIGDIRMCEVCRRDLVVKRRMPRLCLANWLYYGHAELPKDAKDAFKASTFTDRLLLARARSSRVSYRFTELRRPDTQTTATGEQYAERPDASSRSQKCMKGNVLVMPQNSTELTNVLPPPPEVVRDTVCAVFVGRSKPTRESISKFGPLLARKSRLLPIIQFLTRDNVHYACDTDFHGFSQRNLDGLFGPGTEGVDEGIPCGLDVGFINDSGAIQSSMPDYTGRNSDLPDSPLAENDLLMDNVGYTLGSEAPMSHREMKMTALSHCLAGGRFIRSQGGERFIPDFQNPNLLTWLFPHLDPWGIGGFHEPARTVPITMEEQLKYLLELDDNRFEQDPNFAFVYYNILQKKAVFDSVRFKVKVADQTKIVRDLLKVDRTELENLIAKFKRNPRYEPETSEQTRLLSLVNKVGTMLHDLPGTAGYKLKMRNEIRALVSKYGTPAFFITLNPSDINHPLVRLLAGDDIQLEHLEVGQELSEWDRRLVVAQNPAACAKFFHEMISNFVKIVLRHGR